MTGDVTETTVAVVGAGFGGIAMCAQLVRRGVRDVLVLEKGESVGGVWRENTYPGAACDVKSNLYSLSFAQRADWSRSYPTQPELKAYLEDVAREHGVTERTRFGTEVTCAEWDEASGTWLLDTTTGSVRARALVVAVGQLSRPKKPRLPGLEDFPGEVVHTAEWPDGGLDVEGRDVVVVGTGASAIQVVPEIAPRARRTTVFQRTPPYVVAKTDRPHSRLEQAAYARVPGLTDVRRSLTYAWNDARMLAFQKEPTPFTHLFRQLCRLNLRRGVSDPALRERLWPDDPLGCKRVLTSNGWYPALDRDDVAVVPTGVDRFEGDVAVGQDGSRTRADVVVLATGFRSTEFVVPMRVLGRDGRDLQRDWEAGARAHLGMAVPGYPNAFLLYGPNTNLGHNSIIFMIEQQVGYVCQAVDALRTGAKALEVRADVAERSDAEVQERLADSVFAAGCDSWYKTEGGRITNNWYGTTTAYWWRTRRLDPADYRLDTGAAPLTR